VRQLILVATVLHWAGGKEVLVAGINHCQLLTSVIFGNIFVGVFLTPVKVRSSHICWLRSWIFVTIFIRTFGANEFCKQTTAVVMCEILGHNDTTYMPIFFLVLWWSFFTMPQWPSYIYMYRFLKFSIGTHDLLHQVLVTSINHSQIHILRKKTDWTHDRSFTGQFCCCLTCAYMAVVSLHHGQMRLMRFSVLRSLLRLVYTIWEIFYQSQWPSYIYMYSFLKFFIRTHDLLHQVLVTGINHCQIHILGGKNKLNSMTVLLLANFVVA